MCQALFLEEEIKRWTTTVTDLGEPTIPQRTQMRQYEGTALAGVLESSVGALGTQALSLPNHWPHMSSQ